MTSRRTKPGLSILFSTWSYALRLNLYSIFYNSVLKKERRKDLIKKQKTTSLFVKNIAVGTYCTIALYLSCRLFVMSCCYCILCGCGLVYFHSFFKYVRCCQVSLWKRFPIQSAGCHVCLRTKLYDWQNWE